MNNDFFLLIKKHTDTLIEQKKDKITRKIRSSVEKFF